VVGPRRNRTVLHIVYTDLDARLELITRFLPRLESPSPRRRWFFVDVPIGAWSGLEVVQLHAPTDRSVKADLDAWLATCRTRGLVAAASFAERAMVLDPGLFLDGRVPAFYLAAMADCSARAAVLLERHGGPAPDHAVADEIARLFANRIPPRAARRRALDLYATWLERTARGPSPEERVERPDSESEPDPDKGTVRATLVARLAHTQAVRLQGPDYAGGLTREADLVRSLLRVEPTTSS